MVYISTDNKMSGPVGVTMLLDLTDDLRCPIEIVLSLSTGLGDKGALQDNKEIEIDAK